MWWNHLQVNDEECISGFDDLAVSVRLLHVLHRPKVFPLIRGTAVLAIAAPDRRKCNPSTSQEAIKDGQSGEEPHTFEQNR